MNGRSAVAALLALVCACSPAHVVRLDTGHGTPREHRPPHPSASVGVDRSEFEGALARLVLELPLTLRASQQGWLVRASYSGDAESWRDRLLRKGFGGMCRPGQRREDCVSLLDDVMGLSEWDKLGLALGLSFDPMRESIAHAVEDTLAPQLFYSVIGTGLVTWVVLAANPEPVFTKAAAIVSAVMLIYLGIETFQAVLKASVELRRASAKATTLEELQEAGQRFGATVGPEVSRVLVLAVTIVVSHGMTGGAALLASRMSMMPHFAEAAGVGASELGISLSNVGEVSAVAITEGNIAVTLAPTAVAMVAGSDSPGGAGTSSNYRETFFAAHPSLRDQVTVHHAVEQQVLKRYPALFTESEIHSLSNLRGVPKSSNSDLHLSKLRRAWNEFYRTHAAPTKQEVLDFAALLDKQFGAFFEPPL